MTNVVDEKKYWNESYLPVSGIEEIAIKVVLRTRGPAAIELQGK